jgi:TfoX/Sxy family transcriptional regulator of competence genes
MAYDEPLAERVREAIGKRKGVTERKMFGGIAFMLNGNMMCGVRNDDLILRLGPQEGDAALQRKHTRPFDLSPKPMRGMVMIAAEGCKRTSDLQQWVAKAAKFVETLPAK